MVKDRNSYLYLWKTLISLASVDNIISEEEKAWIKKFVEDGKILTDQEKQEVLKELELKTSPEELFEKITIPSHLAQLHHLANNLFKTDELDHKESVYLTRINDMINQRIDLMGASRKSQDYLKENIAKNKLERKNVKGIFQLLAHWYHK